MQLVTGIGAAEIVRLVDDPVAVPVDHAPGRAALLILRQVVLGDADLAPTEGHGESGMGFSIIRAIADDVEIGAGPDGRGTTVRFACGL